MEQYIRPKNLAEKLDVSVKTIYAWAKNKPNFPKLIKLEHSSISLFKLEEVNEFLAKLEEKS